MSTLVLSLSRRKACAPSVAGGKGAGLARLARSGFPVPPGFVIITAAFREPLAQAMKAVYPRPKRNASGAMAGEGPGPGSGDAPLAARDTSCVPPLDLDRARRFCLSWPVPGHLRRAILRARRRLGPGPVAVRSSLVGEDAASASFAGQLDTVLDVEGDDALLEAVRRVLTSAFGDRLWAYLRQTAPAAVPSLSLAVVVQSMVRAEVSGVAFSCDPLTARPGAVVEACRGACEALVQGRVRPDRYRLDARGEIDEIVPAEPGSPLLDEPRIKALGELVGAIAEAAGSPQDIEWAIDGGAFRVLQARPISAIAGKPVYSRRMVSDMAPGLVKPLVWSAKYAPIVQNVFAPVFEEIAGPTGIDYSRMSARLHSRVYMNVTAFGEILMRVGLPPNFFYMLARGDKTGHRRFRPPLRRLPGLVRHVRFIRRESRIGRRVGPFLESQRRKLDRFRGLDWGAQTPAELLGHAARLKELHGRSQWYIILVSINMLIRSRFLGRMIVRRWPGTDPRDVIRGYGRRSSLAPFEELRALAEEAAPLDRALLERMAGEDGFSPAAALAASGRGRSLVRGFEAFMGRFGFLSANGSDFSETPWVEDPRLIWRTVGRLALRRDAAPSPAAAEARREEVLGLVRAGFGPLKRRVFDRLHASTVRYMDCRERVSLLMTEDSYWMRRAYLALGARLVERGTIAAPEDVFYLFEDELPRFLEDTAEAAAAAAKIAARKAEFERDAALDPPDTLCGGEMPGLAPPTADGIEFLAGIGASAGVVKGRARVVRDPALAARDLGPDDVLVVPFTDTGWLPVLAGVGGVVADAGGLLSHTSIIAREYGVPAVVSVRNATRLIPDGAAVTVDGTAGRVYINRD